jgi:hypothetical protein
MTSSPVFIVGPSRSGTTLLQEVLNRHSRFNISAETHWFDDERCRRNQPIIADSDRRDVQDWFLALSHKPFGYCGDPEAGWLKRSDLEREVRATDALATEVHAKEVLATELHGTRDAYFVAACQLDAARHEKSRWGEKTPRHVFRIKDILAAFPDAKILCCVRNPPAMVASYQQWGMRVSHDITAESQSNATVAEKRRTRDSYHPAIAALLWRSAVRRGLGAQQSFGDERVRLVQYEQLVCDAQTTIAELCEWLGEPYEAQMLSVPMINSSFDHFARDAGFVSEPLNRWKQRLTISDRAVVQLLCGREMRHFGYAPICQWHQLWRAIPLLLQLPYACWRAARANRNRIGKLLPYVWRRLRPL